MPALYIKNMEQNNIYSHRYKKFGRFVVEFEQICEKIKNCIRACFELRGLSTDITGQYIMNIMFVGMTANPLAEKFRAIFFEIYGETESYKIVDKLTKVFISIYEIRNLVVHGTWFVRWDADRGFKNKQGAKGLTYNWMTITDEDFQELNSIIEIVDKKYFTIFACLSANNSIEQKIKLEEIDELKRRVRYY